MTHTWKPGDLYQVNKYDSLLVFGVVLEVNRYGSLICCETIVNRHLLDVSSFSPNILYNPEDLILLQPRVEVEEVVIFKCQNCHNHGLPSTWKYFSDFGELALCTNCANNAGGRRDISTMTIDNRSQKKVEEVVLQAKREADRIAANEEFSR